MVPGIGVGEEQQLASGCAITLEAGPRLSVPPPRELFPTDQAYPGIGRQALHDGGSLVRRAVVDYQQLHWLVARVEDGPDDRADGGRFVPRRNHDGHQPSCSDWCVEKIR